MQNDIDNFTKSTIDPILSELKGTLEECGLAVELGKLGPPEPRSKLAGRTVPSSRKTAAEPRSIHVSTRHSSLVINIVYSPAHRCFKLFAYKGAGRLYGRSSIDLERVESDLEQEIYSMVENYLLSSVRPARTL